MKTETSTSILLIDDEEKIANRLGRILSSEGYAVEIAPDGIEGIAKLDTGNFDIVITDLNMPGVSGFEVMEHIQQANLGTLPLVLTGYASVEGAIQAIKLGAYDFIEKPVDAATLKLTINRAAERVELKKENQRHLEELKQLHHLKNEFLGVVSHDLRSPLTSIGGYASYLLKKGSLNDLQHRYLLIIKDIAEHLYVLVNELLDVSKIETGIISLNREHTDVDEIITTSINNFLLLGVDKQNRIEFFNNLNNRQVCVDRMKLLQVLNNLISNAIKFTENGQINITASDHDENQIAIMVQDSGVGITPAEMEVLFDQYNYLHKSGTRGESGNGLGLVICKKFIELHGGTIAVNSECGSGTTFTIIIPRKPADEAAD